MILYKCGKAICMSKLCVVETQAYVTDLLRLPQWTDATFSVCGGAACTHCLKPLPGL